MTSLMPVTSMPMFCRVRIGRLPTGAGAADDDVELADAHLAGLAGGLLGGHLGGVRRRLTGALEPDRAAGRPRHNPTILIGDRDDGVVEAGLDVCLAVRNVPLDARRRLACCATYLSANRYLVTFFFPAMGILLPLRVRALVCVRWPRTGRPRRCRRPW